MKLASVTKSIQKSLKKHAPEILTGIGIAGMISAAVMAVRATPKALRLMDGEKNYRLRNNQTRLYGDEEVEGLVKVDVSGNGERRHYRLPYKDAVKLAWKCYIPSAATGVLSAVCLIGASSVHIRRNAVLATAYSLSETAFREYSEKVVETIGEKKEREIRDSVAEDKIKKDPVSKKEVVITGKGDTLCHDSYT